MNGKIKYVSNVTDIQLRNLAHNLMSRLKCVLVGDGAVGKTSLIISYTTNGYPTEYVPTAFDNYNVVVNVNDQPMRLQLCDTAGQDDFDSLRPLCYPGSDVFLVCFSVVSPTSFLNVRDKWLPELNLHQPRVPILLVGTQSDLRSDVRVLIDLSNNHESPVSQSSAVRLARKHGCHKYIECSALTQKNLKEVFDEAIMLSLDTSSGRVNDGEIPSDEWDSQRRIKKTWKRMCCCS